MGQIAFLWHFHQPDYRDPRTGRPTMPWVRLHGLRGYRDLSLDVLDAGARSTINIVPSLLDQLEYYAKGGDDRHLELTTLPASDLGANEIDEIRSTFVAGNPAMIVQHAPYVRLRDRLRGDEPLDVASLRDLQVWSTLAWFGSTSLRDFPALAELRRKGRGFDEQDKQTMLGVQREIVAGLPGVFGRLATSDTASVSTTPYYHPILPLLIDNRLAKRSMPDLPDAELRFAWPADARLQLVRARERFGEALGTAPIGLWPSEGSVSPEVVEVAADAGFRWLSSDEGVLARSQRVGGGKPGAWDLGHGMVGFFRDRDLSDRIGFDYARRDPADAARELVGAALERAGDGVLLIALDGENPWEAFRDAGEAFRAHLHARLRGRDVTLDEASTRRPVGTVQRLHTGSWIGANLDIWIGHPDDRHAWRLLDDCRRAIAAAPPDQRDGALERLLPAEGSDWMWWYGEEFSTPFAGMFDELFRAHIRSAWEALGRKPPEELDHPVGLVGQAPIAAATAVLDPVVEPRPSWVRWQGAGRARFPQGAMAHGNSRVSDLRYGWSRDGALWLRVDLSTPSTDPPGSMFRLRAGDLSVDLPSGGDGRVTADGVTAAGGDVAIVARFEADRLPGRAVPVALSLLSGGDKRVSWPADGVLLLPRPPAGAPLAFWSA